jgi:glycosyltransferase involved in cell wall biosynthesis
MEFHADKGGILAKISFAITTHNENGYIRTLIDQLAEFIKAGKEDCEVVVLDDFSDSKETLQILVEIAEYPNVSVYRRKFAGDFAEHKNYLSGLCRGEYIFQLDADERLAPTLLDFLPSILIENSEVDLFLVPRINIVDGLTQAHIDAWGWSVNEHGWVQWPDYQTRIYRNKPSIRWVGKVHERIQGFGTYAYLPAEESYCIIHHKTIERQEQQNKFYSAIH